MYTIIPWLQTHRGFNFSIFRANNINILHDMENKQAYTWKLSKNPFTDMKHSRQSRSNREDITVNLILFINQYNEEQGFVEQLVNLNATALADPF